MSKSELKTSVLNTNQLLLVKFLLLEAEKERKLLCKYGNSFIYNNFYLFDNYKIIEKHELASILTHLLKQDIISELYIEREEFNEKKDCPVTVGKRHITHQQIKKALESSIFFNLLTHEESKAFMLQYFMRLNIKKAQNFIAEYLLKWKNDKLILHERNLLKAQRQLEKVASHIFYLLSDYPAENLIVKRIGGDIDKPLDFVATMLFLEQIGDIEIMHISFEKDLFDTSIAMRVNITDKFFDDFEKDYVRPKFDFPKLANLNEKIGAGINNKIRLVAPRLLEYKGAECKLYEGASPLYLINLAREHKGIVDYEAYRKLAPMPKNERDKDLKQFRRRLRQRFKLKTSALLFEIKGGQIVFDMDMFDLS